MAGEVRRLVIENNEDLRTKVAKYFYDGAPEFTRQYPIGLWDVSNVTDMSGLFSGRRNFNESLNDWDTSNVTNMGGMFSDCKKFNQPLDNWNVSKVTNMSAMFWNAKKFNQNLNNWDVSNVIKMVSMFSQCSSFNQPLNNWNTSNVINMESMFFSCGKFNQPLNNWNVSNVINMYGMLQQCSSFDQPLNNWNVSNVTDMEYMFEYSKKFKQPLNMWVLSTSVKTTEMFDNTNYPVEFMPSRVQSQIQEAQERQLMREERQRRMESERKKQEQEQEELRRKSVIRQQPITFDLKVNNTCFDLIEGETTIESALTEGNSVFVFYTTDINVSQRVSVSSDMLRKSVNKKSYLVYECKRPNAMGSIDRETKYFNIKKLTGFGDVVLHSDMVALLNGLYEMRVYIFQKTDKELVTTASHDVVFGSNPSYVGDRHCQEGQNASVYELMKNVVFENGETVGGKRTRTRRKRRTNRKRKANRIHATKRRTNKRY